MSEKLPLQDCPIEQDKLTELPKIEPAVVSRWVYTGTLLVLFFLSLALTYQIIQPYLHTLILSIVVTVVCYPLYHKILEWTKHRSRSFAAGAVLFLVCFCVALPLFLFFIELIPQAIHSVASASAWLNELDVEKLLQSSAAQPYLLWVHENFSFINLSQVAIQKEISEISRTVGQFILQGGTKVLGNTLTLCIHFALMLAIVFFLLKNGENMVHRIKYLLPMHESKEDTILVNLRYVTRSVFVGGLLVAALQGFVGGVGLQIVGLPALFWGTVMGAVSLVPVLGTGLVWVPATAYLFFIGEWKSAVFLLCWCGILVTSIDSFLRPYFMRDSVGVSVLVIFLSIIGGISVFNIAGILYGPLILSFLLVMLRLYGEEFQELLSSKSLAHCPHKK